MADLIDAARELCDLVDASVDGAYTPDSFTTQPLRLALAEVEMMGSRKFKQARQVRRIREGRSRNDEVTISNSGEVTTRVARQVRREQAS